MDIDDAVVIVKQPMFDKVKVIKRSMSTSALSAAKNIKSEFIHNFRSHISLTTTGDAHDAFDVERSVVVGASCFPFLILSLIFFRNGFMAHGVQFILQAWLSFQADCWNTKSKWYNSADRISASGVIILGPVRVILLPIAGLAFKLQAAACLTISGLILAWSRKSKCQKDYVIRHTCWHLAGFLSVFLYADRLIYNRTYDNYWPIDKQFWHFGA